MKRELRIRTSTALIVAGLAAVFFGAVGMVVAYKMPKPRPFVFAPNTIPLYPDPAAAFQFNPKADITAYELAIVMMAFNGTNQSYDRMRPLYDQMPPAIKRHWIELEKKPSPAPAAQPAVPHQDAPKF